MNHVLANHGKDLLTSHMHIITQRSSLKNYFSKCHFKIVFKNFGVTLIKVPNNGFNVKFGLKY